MSNYFDFRRTTRYSRVRNKRNPFNKRSPWNIWGKKNKHSPLKKNIPLHQITEFQTFFMDYSL